MPPRHDRARGQPSPAAGGVPAIADPVRDGSGALEAERDVLATIVDTAPIGILVTGPDNRVLRVNHSFCSVVGRPASALVGTDLLDLAHAEDVGFEILARERILEAGDDTLRRTMRYLRPDGSAVVVDIATTLVRGAAGEPSFFVSEVRDITAEQDANEERERMAAQLRASERRFRALATSAPACLFETDRDGSFVWVNERWQELTGHPDEDALGEGWIEAVFPEDVMRVLVEWRSTIHRRARYGAELRLVRGDGTVRWVTMSAAPLLADDGEPVGMLGVFVDITEPKRVEERLRDTEELFRRSFEDAPIGMILASVDGTVARANDALAAFLGYDIAAVWVLGLFGLFHPDDGEEIRADVERLVADGAGTISTEKRLLTSDGQHVWAQVAASLVKDADGSVHVLVQMQDMTERRHYEEQLRWMADHDPLTGLANRRRLEQELDRQLKLIQRYGPRGSLLLFDLDHFKSVNDTLGHAAGDDLLVHVADLLRERLRATDLAARLGGDEFAVLIPEGDDVDARVVAETICERVRDHAATVCAGHPFRVSASVGVVLFSDIDAETPDDVLAGADLALYDVKEAGRDGYAFFTRDRHAKERSRTGMTWGQEIRDALAEDRLILHAQPICDIVTGAVEQYELLVRLLTRGGETVPPGVFLGIAERIDIVQAIDRRVVEKASAIAAERRRRGQPVRLAVNLSVRSLVESGLIEAIEREVTSGACAADDLVFEITETAAVGNIQHARAFAERLAALGCQLALDDFGAGFGGFYYLKHLPFDFLKIDGEFVKALADNLIDKLVIEAVVRIAQGLGKRTIAEFVEDDATREILRLIGVDLVQGFAIGRPAPVDELLALTPARRLNAPARRSAVA